MFLRYLKVDSQHLKSKFRSPAAVITVTEAINRKSIYVFYFCNTLLVEL